MMEFKSIASSSAANLSFLTDGATRLLLDTGLPIRDIERRLDFQLGMIDGAIITHSHADHSMGVHGLITRGIDVYCSRGTAEAWEVANHHRIHIVEAHKQFRIGSFRIKPFEALHDCDEPLCYLLSSANKRMLFAQDTAWIKYRFPRLDIIAVGVNYCEDVVAEQDIPPPAKRRLYNNHMSIQRFIRFLKANDLTACREIHLLHLSGDNSVEQDFKRQVMEETGVPVYIGAV